MGMSELEDMRSADATPRQQHRANENIRRAIEEPPEPYRRKGNLNKLRDPANIIPDERLCGRLDGLIALAADDREAALFEAIQRRLREFRRELHKLKSEEGTISEWANQQQACQKLMNAAGVPRVAGGLSGRLQWLLDNWQPRPGGHDL